MQSTSVGLHQGTSRRVNIPACVVSTPTCGTTSFTRITIQGNVHSTRIAMDDLGIRISSGAERHRVI